MFSHNNLIIGMVNEFVNTSKLNYRKDLLGEKPGLLLKLPEKGFSSK